MASLLPELYCQVFSYPMTLQEFLFLRETSVDIKKRVESCLRYLISSDQEAGKLSASMINSMIKIEEIAPEYPIIISNQDELLTIAKHPTLRQATFDIMDLREDPLLLIVSFFEQFITSNSNFPIESILYDFTFLGLNEDGGIIGIQIVEESIRLTNFFSYSEEKLRDFYVIISKYIPINAYYGPLDIALKTVSSLPFLGSVYFNIDLSFTLSIPNRPVRTFVSNLLDNHNITQYYISYPHSDTEYEIGTDEPINNIIGFTHRIIYLYVNRIFNHVKVFLPFSYEDIGSVKDIFPNLESISISLNTVDFFLQQRNISHLYIDKKYMLNNFQEIILVIDTEIFRGEEYYLNLFPHELRGMIRFIDSDWM